MKETYTIAATVQAEVRVEANDIEEAIQIVKGDLQFGTWEVQDHVQINAVRKEGK